MERLDTGIASESQQRPEGSDDNPGEQQSRREHNNDRDPLPEWESQESPRRDELHQLIAETTDAYFFEQPGNLYDGRCRKLPDRDAVGPWNVLEDHVDLLLRCFDPPDEILVGREPVVGVPFWLGTKGFGMDPQEAIEHEGKLTGQLRCLASPEAGGQAARVQIFRRSPPVSFLCGTQEALDRCARDAAVEVVRGAWRLGGFRGLLGCVVGCGVPSDPWSNSLTLGSSAAAPVTTRAISTKATPALRKLAFIVRLPSKPPLGALALAGDVS